MKIKATIQKNSPAAEAIKQYQAQKEAFKKAAEKGKAVNYVRSQSREKTAEPV